MTISRMLMRGPPAHARRVDGRARPRDMRNAWKLSVGIEGTQSSATSSNSGIALTAPQREFNYFDARSRSDRTKLRLSRA